MADTWSRLFKDIFLVTSVTIERRYPGGLSKAEITSLSVDIAVEAATRFTDPRMPPLESDVGTQTSDLDDANRDVAGPGPRSAAALARLNKDVENARALLSASGVGRGRGCLRLAANRL